jgi:hypothetical protein
MIMDKKSEREVRKYIRHATDMPIEVQLADLVTNKREYLNNISFGGMSFKSGSELEKGTVVRIKIPLSRPVFEAKGKVMWCQKKGTGFDVGVEFVGPKDDFKLRMLQQICHIENYKREIQEKKGRAVTGEEAALEWIKKYAHNFPK